MPYEVVDAQWFVVHQHLESSPNHPDGRDRGLVVFCSREDIEAKHEQIPGFESFLNCGSDLEVALEHAAAIYATGELGAPFTGRSPEQYDVELADRATLLVAKGILIDGRSTGDAIRLSAGHLNQVRMLATSGLDFAVTPVGVAKAQPISEWDDEYGQVPRF